MKDFSQRLGKVPDSRIWVYIIDKGNNLMSIDIIVIIFNLLIP